MSGDYHATYRLYPRQYVPASSRRSGGGGAFGSPTAINDEPSPPPGYDRSQFAGSSSEEEDDEPAVLPRAGCVASGVGDVGPHPGGGPQRRPALTAGAPGPSLQTVHQSLEEMLATCARLQGELQASNAGQTAVVAPAAVEVRGSLSAFAASQPPASTLKDGFPAPARRVTGSSAGGPAAQQPDSGLAPDVAAKAGPATLAKQQVRLLGAVQLPGGSAATSRPSSGARGPLEALRDELFSGFTVPAVSNGAAATAAASQSQPAPSGNSSVTGMGTLPATPVGTGRQMARSVSQNSGAAWLSPTPSIRAASMALHEEQSSAAMQSVADLSSIYSMPESALNAAVGAVTPMSYTTAAVSELDTPTSSGSHEEEYYYKVSPGGNGGFGSLRGAAATTAAAAAARRSGGGSGLVTGYEDYVQPAAWTSLRERHSNAGPSPSGIDAGQHPTAADVSNASGIAPGRLTAEQQLVAALATGESGSGSAAHVPEAQALPPTLSLGDSISGRAVSFGLPTLAAGVAGALNVDSTANLAEAATVAPGSASVVDRECAASSQLIRSLSFGGLAPGSVSNVNTPGVSAGGAAMLPDGAGASPSAPAASPAPRGFSLDTTTKATTDSRVGGSASLQQPSGTGERGDIGNLTFVNPLFDPAHPEDSFGAKAAPDKGSSGGQSSAAAVQPGVGVAVGADSTGCELEATEVDEEQEVIEEDVPEAQSGGDEEPVVGQMIAAQAAALGEPSTDEAPQGVASSPQGTTGSGSGGAGLQRQQSWGSSAAGLAAAAGGGTGNALPPAMDAPGETVGPAEAAVAVEERPIVTAAARFMSSPGAPVQEPTGATAAVDRGFASTGDAGTTSVSLPAHAEADGAMHTPWMDTATAAAAAGSGALLRFSACSAAAAAAAGGVSQGGASGYSGMSAALVGSVPQQDREERVRSWAQTEADFAAMPMGSGSNGGAGNFQESGSGWAGMGGRGIPTAVAEVPADASSMTTRAAAVAAAAGLAIPDAPLGAVRATVGRATTSSAAAAPDAAAAASSSSTTAAAASQPFKEEASSGASSAEAALQSPSASQPAGAESLPAPKDSLEARTAQVLQCASAEPSSGDTCCSGAAGAAGEASSSGPRAAATPVQPMMPIIAHASGGSGSATSVTAAADAALAALTAADVVAHFDGLAAGQSHSPVAAPSSTQPPDLTPARPSTVPVSTALQPAPSPTAVAPQGAGARASGAEGTAAVESDAAVDADLDRLLSMLSGRGARSEAHMRMGFDSFRSAVVTAAIAPRPRSAPGIAMLAAAMAEAAADMAAEEEQQRQQQHGTAAAAAATSVRSAGLPGRASLTSSVGGNSPRSPMAASGRLSAIPAGSAERSSAQLPTLSRISAGASPRVQPDADSAAAAPPNAMRPTSSITLQPHPVPVHHQSQQQLNLHGHMAAQARSNGLPEHPHPHLQPHLPLHPHLHMHASVGNSQPPPQPLSTTASLASIDSEVAAERLKAKTRAYLARGSGGGSSKGSAAHGQDAVQYRSGHPAVVVVPSTISEMRTSPPAAGAAAAPFRDSAGMELSLAELHLPLDDLLVQAQRLRIEEEEEEEGEDAPAEEVEEEIPGSQEYEDSIKSHAGPAGVTVAAIASAAPALGDSSSELDDIIRQLHNLMGAAAAAKAVQLDRATKDGIAVTAGPRCSPQDQQAHEEEERRELEHLREVQQMARDEVAREQMEQRQHQWEEEQQQSRKRFEWLQDERERQEREARAVAALQRFGDVGSPVRGIVQSHETTATGSVSFRLEEENSRTDVSPWSSGPSTAAPSPPVSRASGWAPAQQAQGSGSNSKSASARASGPGVTGYAANRRQQHGRAEASRLGTAPAPISASGAQPAAASAASVATAAEATDAGGTSMASYLQLAAQAAALRSQVNAAYSGQGPHGGAQPLLMIQPPSLPQSDTMAQPYAPQIQQRPPEAAAALGGPQSMHWHAALAAKLLPPDALQQRSNGGYHDAAVALSDWKVPAALAVSQSAPAPGAAANAGAHQQGASAVTSARSGAASGTASHARAQSPAAARGAASTATGPETGGASCAASRPRRPGSAPSTPARGNSPARQHASGNIAATAVAPGTRDGGSFPLNPAKSPRSGRDARVGSSILDRAAQRPGTAAAGRASPSRGRSPTPAAVDPELEPISIRRPFAWQERETRHWLEDVGLMVSPAEEAAPLLDNPLRNGLLLASLAVRLTGTPLPAGVLTDPPRDVRSARTNILCAVDHLGLLAAPWAPPTNEEQRVRAEAAASDLAAAAAAIGTGRSRSPSPSHSGANMGSSGIIAIKALGNAGRGYALRLKERQLRAGLGLVAEVEAVLAGHADSVWGLLNFIRLACAPQYMMGSGAFSAARGDGRAGYEEMHSLRTFNVRGGPGPNGTSTLGPAPTSVSPSRAASPARTIAAAASKPGSRAASPARASALATTSSSPGGGGGGASMSPRKMYATIVSEQAVLASRAGHRGGLLVHGAVADPRGSLGAILHGSGAAAAAAAAAAATGSALLFNPSGAAGGGGSSPTGASASDVPAGLLYRPLWPRLSGLPYGTSELAALESSLLRWLMESGSISRREAAEGFAALIPMFEDGTFICWLVSNLSGKPIVGAHRRPLTDTARRTNWLKAIEALRALPGMSRRFLLHEEALIHCCRPELTGLLEDLHRLSDGQPPPPGTLLPDAQPYLPYVAPMPEPEMLDPELLALNRTALTLPAGATVRVGSQHSPTTSPARLRPLPTGGGATSPPGGSPSPSPSRQRPAGGATQPANANAYHTTARVLAEPRQAQRVAWAADSQPSGPVSHAAAPARPQSADRMRRGGGFGVAGSAAAPAEAGIAARPSSANLRPRSGSTGSGALRRSAAAGYAGMGGGGSIVDKLITPTRSIPTSTRGAASSAAPRQATSSGGGGGAGFPTAAHAVDSYLAKHQQQGQLQLQLQRPYHEPLAAASTAGADRARQQAWAADGADSNAAAAATMSTGLRLVPAPRR
ncbi:hypothetical protein HYH02_000368 [Chlamydomonas schloesseri]|uniref:Uncharacterized protein n=1 Tax=Chlamydomonas schloesseri TaxID=2026947 RepID=A0A836BCK5_9CHLO|nr:hypothetical protein HYH02_000368 [Chlamydomonas schloesseri]|eukprot:KAG2454521.1 hypothetical protein HYH02_000368 [Chlamydomonas schloesseri]